MKAFIYIAAFIAGMLFRTLLTKLIGIPFAMNGEDVIMGVLAMGLVYGIGGLRKIRREKEHRDGR